MNRETVTGQNVFLYNRSRAELSSVTEIGSFQENCVVLLCEDGSITIEGDGLKIDSFSAESGNVCISGRVNGIYYLEETVSGGFFRRRK